MNFCCRSFLFLTWITFSLNLFADTIIEEFTTLTYQGAGSTAVWNTVLGKVHPTLLINNFEDPPSLPDSKPALVGDGHDGAFNISTYSNFGTVAGNVITIDASLFPVLNLTHFHLASGYTLTSINGPLVIFSLSDVIIDGTILCDGLNGEDAIGTIGGAGGLGRCDGNTGGAGGNSTSSGSTGLPSTGLVSGGGGGNYVSIAPGAGGGGAGSFYGSDGNAGQNSTPSTNLAGAGGNGNLGGDADFSSLSGSPGGGGGSGSDTEGGGGGGGGGGTVVIHAVGDVTISATGNILARGGNGGNANTGGGGGGGGGGSVQIFSPGQLVLVPAAVVIDVSGGAGAIPTLGNAGDGGAGTNGRTWLLPFVFTGPGTESHVTLLANEGVVEYSQVAESIVSKSYDTGSTLAKFNSISAFPTATGITFEVAGSNDDFSTDDTGWISASQFSQLDGKRFVKFKATLNNTSATSPLEMDSVIINYDSGLKEEFTFKGCGTVKTNSTGGGNLLSIWFILVMTLLPLLLTKKLKMIKSQ
ncbi:MAG: hypothetical protein A2622_07245 [Bdellovibrionales bacterium RIFCSPHIGHO2_01_FULL_40_29]|nr:MAG: hypothetical protein A2622_07245 [Bdellovibrionales bacterium RIFCSPHIGHO2_01_FULL_40_29]